MIDRSDIIKLAVGVGVLMAIAGGVDYWKEKKYKEQDERAYMVYKLEREVIENPSPKKLEELIKVSGGSVYALALASDLGREEYLDTLIDKLSDEHLKKLFTEKKAYLLYRAGKNKEALKLLSEIKKEDFNYPSALLLKAIIYEKEGNIKKAKSLYETLLTKYPITYFGKVANTRLSILEMTEESS
jgi:predicted negative regulator of RcsB-dependent stress response